MLKTTHNTFEGRVIKSLEEKFLGTSMSIETCLFQILVEETARAHDAGYSKGFINGRQVGISEGSHECKIHYEEERRNSEYVHGCTLTQKEMMRFIEELYEIYLAGKRTGFNKGFLYGVK